VGGPRARARQHVTSLRDSVNYQRGCGKYTAFSFTLFLSLSLSLSLCLSLSFSRIRSFSLSARCLLLRACNDRFNEIRGLSLPCARDRNPDRYSVNTHPGLIVGSSLDTRIRACIHIYACMRARARACVSRLSLASLIGFVKSAYLKSRTRTTLTYLCYTRGLLRRLKRCESNMQTSQFLPLPLPLPPPPRS